MTLTISSLHCPPRLATARNRRRRTLGRAAAVVAGQFGRPFMPWQDAVADVALEVNDAGYLHYRLVVLVVPRQQGKSTVLQAVMVRSALGAYDQTILYAAQDRTEARRRLLVELHERTLARARPFRRRYTTRMTNGDESLRFVTGSTIGIVAPTATAGHGNTLDLGVIDEAFAHSTLELPQAFGPAMVTRRNAQLWVVSVVGDGTDLLLQHYQDEGLSSLDDPDTRTAYFEWSNLDGDPYAESTWRSCMPALGYTVQPDDVRADPTYGDPDEFARAYLCRRRPARSTVAIDLDAWAAAARAAFTLVDPVVLGFDVSADRTRSSIAAASVADVGYAVELIDHRPGTAWVVPALVEYNRRHRPAAIVVDGPGPAGALLTELERHRLPLRVLTAQQVVRACGQFVDDVGNGAVAHLAQTPLEDAVGSAGRLYHGDAFRWRRRDRASTVDLSPLYAVTLARYGAATAPGEAVVAAS